jgi:uncharacterized membrane protein YedE/YeeE
MRALASLACGFIFGWGLLISGMVMPTKVLGFLDILAIPSGGWDPSLAVVMAAALAVSGLGYLVLRPSTPLFDTQFHLPTQSAIDRPLFVGSVMFGAGWGLVGLCPGPAIENLATLSTPVIVFVVAMAVGMIAHDLWQARSPAPQSGALAPASAGDG